MEYKIIPRYRRRGMSTLSWDGKKGWLYLSLEDWIKMGEPEYIEYYSKVDCLAIKPLKERTRSSLSLGSRGRHCSAVNLIRAAKLELSPFKRDIHFKQDGDYWVIEMEEK